MSIEQQVLEKLRNLPAEKTAGAVGFRGFSESEEWPEKAPPPSAGIVGRL